MKPSKRRKHSDRLAPAAVELLLTIAVRHDPELLPLLVLLVFGGVRFNEVCRLRWECINFGLEKINIIDGREFFWRVLSMPQNLTAWLRPFEHRTGLLYVGSAAALSARLGRLYRRAGVRCRAGSLRGTFAWYHYHRCFNLYLTAEALGLRAPVYSAPRFIAGAADHEVEAFWNIFPPEDFTRE